MDQFDADQFLESWQQHQRRSEQDQDRQRARAAEVAGALGEVEDARAARYLQGIPLGNQPEDPGGTALQNARQGAGALAVIAQPHATSTSIALHDLHHAIRPGQQRDHRRGQDEEAVVRLARSGGPQPAIRQLEPVRHTFQLPQPQPSLLPATTSSLDLAFSAIASLRSAPPPPPSSALWSTPASNTVLHTYHPIAPPQPSGQTQLYTHYLIPHPQQDQQQQQLLQDPGQISLSQHQQPHQLQYQHHLPPLHPHTSQQFAYVPVPQSHPQTYSQVTGYYPVTAYATYPAPNDDDNLWARQQRLHQPSSQPQQQPFQAAQSYSYPHRIIPPPLQINPTLQQPSQPALVDAFQALANEGRLDPAPLAGLLRQTAAAVDANSDRPTTPSTAGVGDAAYASVFDLEAGRGIVGRPRSASAGDVGANWIEAVMASDVA
ncbi:hypothetical protein HK101_006551, partial [Irineochytrium annulatum]